MRSLWLRAVVGFSVGLCGGLGGYTFVYANGASYMTNDPAACSNCHVMREQYNGWTRSSHHAVATCNDCHTPHDLVGKYATKARNGWHHSVAFTTGKFHEPIRIGPRNLAITEAACRHCHEDIVQQIDRPDHAGSELSCVRCHPNVGHLH
ncbi:MAG: cytochrome c nitrite reductase small subunit [Fimbriimonadaceae bacterium]|nr:cytochrome c nitrite reductase small subunit [Fimbriimonadaceae bacterium]